MAPFGILVHGLSDRTDLVVGTTAAGRPDPRTEDIVGVFVNPLPLRLRLDPDAPVRRFVAGVHATLVDFHEHGNYPMEDLVAHVPPFTGAGLNDTFHCYLLFQNYWRPPDGELRFRPLPLPTAAHHKLMRELEIVLEEPDGELRGELWYRPSRFDPHRVAGWRDTFAALVRLLATDPLAADLPVRELLALAERQP
jgi:non-ribosomal peptide synthetase component F